VRGDRAASLLEGADVNARDRDDRTVLMHAASRSSGEVVEVLLRSGADVSVRDRAGRTALDFAKRYGDPNAGRTEIVKLLER
jgi:ankyrin repeat protein